MPSRFSIEVKSQRNLPREQGRVAPGLSATCSQADWRLGWKHGTTGGCRRSHGTPRTATACAWTSNPMRSVSVSALTALHFAPLHDWMKGCAWSGQRRPYRSNLTHASVSVSALRGTGHGTARLDLTWRCGHTHTCLALDSHRPPMSFYSLIHFKHTFF